MNESNHKRRWVLILSLLIGVFLLHAGAQSTTNNNVALMLEVKGAIGPASQDYIQRSITKASEIKANLIILQIDTPGGLDKSMRNIIRDIVSSPIPVAVFVAPSGARAASAGTFILYASHIAAMAPGTNLGAASPVSIGMTGAGKNDKESAKSTMEKKVSKDAAAYIRSLAQMRDRNVEWAEQAVLKAESISAEEALKKNVIDLIANDTTDLLKKIDGKKLEVSGRNVTLDTKNMTVQQVNPDWRTKFLAIITDPSIAYILLLVGVYGLFFEFANPGFVLPGVAGVICLLLALYAFQLLPINYVGLGLIILGIIFMVLEAFVPSFGALGVGGIIAFIVGSVLLMDTESPEYAIAWPIILSVAFVTAGFILLVVNMALRARFQPVVSGGEEVIGSIGDMVISNGNARMRLRGELWQVTSDEKLRNGQRVRVVGRKGLILLVAPLENQS